MVIKQLTVCKVNILFFQDEDEADGDQEMEDEEEKDVSGNSFHLWLILLEATYSCPSASEYRL